MQCCAFGVKKSVMRLKKHTQQSITQGSSDM
jgi:hypothetical protein